MNKTDRIKHIKNLNEFCQLRKKYLIIVAKTERRTKKMHAKFEKDKSFKNELVKFFERNRKRGWGKNQVVGIIKDLWIKHLESLVKNQKEV